MSMSVNRLVGWHSGRKAKCVRPNLAGTRGECCHGDWLAAALMHLFNRGRRMLYRPRSAAPQGGRERAKRKNTRSCLALRGPVRSGEENPDR